MVLNKYTDNPETILEVLSWLAGNEKTYAHLFMFSLLGLTIIADFKSLLFLSHESHQLQHCVLDVRLGLPQIILIEGILTYLLT